MKYTLGNKLLTAGVFTSFVLCSAMATSSAASAIGNNAFEDPNFYACVVKQFNASFPGEITMAQDVSETNLSDSQLAKIDELRCHYSLDGNTDGNYYTAPERVTSYNGIEKLTGIKNIDLADQRVGGRLDLSSNTALLYASLHNNNFTSIVLPASGVMKELNIAGNELSAIDLSKQTALYRLELSYNKIANLDLSNNPNLTFIGAQDNLLTSLDLSHNKKLAGLVVVGNNISMIDVSNQPNFVELFAPLSTNVYPYTEYGVNDSCELTLKLKFVGVYNTIMNTEHYSFDKDAHLLTFKSLPSSNYVRALETVSGFKERSATYSIILGDQLVTEFNKTKDCKVKEPDAKDDKPSKDGTSDKSNRLKEPNKTDKTEGLDVKAPDTGAMTGENNGKIITTSITAIGLVVMFGYLVGYILNRRRHHVKF